MVMPDAFNRAPITGASLMWVMPPADSRPGAEHAQIAAVNAVMDYFEVLDRHYLDDDKLFDPARTQSVSDLLHSAEKANLQALLDFLNHCTSE